MKIGFIGDIHARVFHTLALITAWQERTGQKLDLIIQVGDLGAYPDPSDDVRNEKYVRQDPAELDFMRLLQAEGRIAECLHFIRANVLQSPIYFIRGNHEDFDWLEAQHAQDSQESKVRVDPFDLFHYVKDGTIWELNHVRMAFLGGIQTREHDRRSIEPDAYANLNQLKPGEIDILITHDAPYGIGTNFLGHTQGSTLISDLIATITPQYLIAGHYHHMNGPRAYGATTYLGLNVLVDLRDDGVHRRVQPGSMAVLETTTNQLQYVTDDWLSSIDRDFNFLEYIGGLLPEFKR